MLKVGTFTLFNERPDRLVYHDRCFHVLDMKVYIIICFVSYYTKYQSFQSCRCLDVTFGSVSEVLSCPLHPLTGKEEITVSTVENSDGSYIETTPREASGDSTVITHKEISANGVDENFKVTAPKEIATIGAKESYGSIRPTILKEVTTSFAAKQKDGNATVSITKSTKDSCITSIAKETEFYTASAIVKGSVVDCASLTTKETNAQNMIAPAMVLNNEGKAATAMETPTPNNCKEAGDDWLGSTSKDAESSISSYGVNSAPNDRESYSKSRESLVQEINIDCSEGKAEEKLLRGTFRNTVISIFLQY